MSPRNDLLKRINGYMRDYILGVIDYDLYPNCHHRQTFSIHSVWTAKYTEKLISENPLNLAERLSPSLKMITILGGLFHDVGKDDMKKEAIHAIKPNHTASGFSNIQKLIGGATTSKRLGYLSLLNFCSDDEIQKYTGKKKEDLLGIFAIISKYHQKLGDMMQKKDTIENFIKELMDDCIKSNLDHFKDIDNMLKIVLIISMADVKGSWHLEYKSSYSELSEYDSATNRFENCPDPNIDCKHICQRGHPWTNYGYDKQEFVDLVDKIVNSMQESLLQFRRGYQLNYKSVSNNYDLEFNMTQLDNNIVFYKAVTKPVEFRNTYKTYNKVSWFSRTKNVPINYIGSPFGVHQNLKEIGIFNLIDPIYLIRLDDKKTLNSLITILNNGNLTIAMSNQDRMNCLQLFKDAFTHGLQQDLQGNLLPCRYSIYQWDLDIMNNFICSLADMKDRHGRYIFHDGNWGKIRISGYIINEVGLGNRRFHEEFAICRPAGKLNLIDIVDANNLKSNPLYL